ncbi:MAG: hypothetical protein HOQ22_08575 [Nocardioidaceae bacterium]|nr:hypothetical protein [Nocardioidaceae bacterium]
MPTDDDVRALLRVEVARFRQRETRRAFDAAVYVGRLGGPRDAFVVRAQDLPAVDAALRTDVVAALLEDAPDHWTTAWLARPGLPDLHDDDLRWFAAARTGFGMHDRSLAGFYAVTRYGWLDVRTGERRTWRRLRLRESPAKGPGA